MKKLLAILIALNLFSASFAYAKGTGHSFGKHIMVHGGAMYAKSSADYSSHTGPYLKKNKPKWIKGLWVPIVQTKPYSLDTKKMPYDY